MKLFPVVTKDGTQGSLFLGVMDREMSEAEKKRGTSLAEEALTTWKDKATEYVVNLPSSSEFTADDLVAEVGLPTYEDGRPNNNGVGACISGMAKRKLIYPAGFTTSDRVTNHGRVLRIWRVVHRP